MRFKHIGMPSHFMIWHMCTSSHRKMHERQKHMHVKSIQDIEEMYIYYCASGGSLDETYRAPQGPLQTPQQKKGPLLPLIQKILVYVFAIFNCDILTVLWKLGHSMYFSWLGCSRRKMNKDFKALEKKNTTSSIPFKYSLLTLISRSEISPHLLHLMGANFK